MVTSPRMLAKNYYSIIIIRSIAPHKNQILFNPASLLVIVSQSNKENNSWVSREMWNLLVFDFIKDAQLVLGRDPSAAMNPCGSWPTS